MMMALIFYTIAIVCFSISYTEAFAYTQTSIQQHIHSRSILADIYSHNIPKVSLSRRYSTTKLYNLFPKDEFDRDDFLDDDDDDDWDSEKYEPAVAAQIRKAKQLLNETKKKQKQQEDSFLDTELVIPPKEEDESKEVVLPFFATKQREIDSTKIKSKTKSGEIIADGTQMATLSKSEAWERRSLSQMFTKEARQDWDGNDVTQESSTTLADKDVARSIYNLRKSMQNEDFKKVFDSRNRFIGEVE